MLVTFTSVDATCGDCNGEMTASVSGGSGTYDFIWSNNGTTSAAASSTQTGLCSGIIQVSVTDQLGCAMQETNGLNNIGGPTGLTVTGTIASCFNAGDAQATATATGGQTPYSYLWFPTPQTTATATGLTVTVHTVEVTDINNCKIIENVTITDPPEIVDNVSSFPTTCGQSDGSISVGISGGVPPYTSYTWNVTGTTNAATTTAATGLAQGIVSLTVTDFNACEQVFNYNMDGSDAPSITLTVNDVDCNGSSTGEITSTVSGGTTAYAYQWLDSPGLNPIAGETSANLTGVPAGTYYLQVTDAAIPDNCVATLQAEVEEPDPVQFSSPVGIDPTCFNTSDGTANVVPIGGTVPYNFVWGNGASASGPTATGLIAGTYPVTLTDNLGCSIVDSVIITSPDTVFVDTISSGTTLCSDGTNGAITLNVTGGDSNYSFVWNNTSSTSQNLTGLAPGVWIVTVADGNNCSVQDTIAIGGVQVSGIVSDVSCFGGEDGSISLSPTGFATPFSYQWSPPPAGSSSNVQNVLGLEAIGYIVTVTDSLGCSTTETFDVDESPSISVTFNEVASTCGDCDGQLTAVTTGGASGYNYLWSNNGTAVTETGLCAGLYEVSVTDANGCAQLFSTGLSDIGGPTSASLTITPPSCFGIADANACVSVTGGSTPYAYAWNPSGTTPSNSCTGGLTTGTVNVEITDANGCKLVIDSIITTPSEITDSISMQSTTCGGSDGTISVYNNGGGTSYTYLWSNGSTSSSLTGLAQGAIVLTVTDNTGCSEDFFYNINGSDAPSISITKNDVSCFDGSNGDATSFVTGGTIAYAYQWTDATLNPIAGETNPTISGLTEGCYFLSVSDAAIPTCVATQIICIDQPDSIQFSVPSGLDPSCFNTSDGSATTIPVGGTLPYSFLWDDPAPQSTSGATGLAAGSYHVTMTDANGCFAIDSVILTAPPAIIIDTISSSTELCSGALGGMISISVTGGSSSYGFVWSNGETTQNISGLTAGNYCVTVSDGNNCSETACWSVGGPSIDAVTITDALCYNSCDGSVEIDVSGTATPFSYVWNPAGILTEDVSGLCPGNYSISITDTNLCSVFLDTFAIGQPDTMQVSFDTTSATCGITPCNGAITANPFGGTSPYMYQWSDPLETGQTINGVCAGIHPVSISDANGCSEVFLAGLSDIGGADSIAITSSDVTCFDGNDGNASVTNVYGGTSPYTYSWTPISGNSNSINNLTAGILFVQVTDDNNCVLVDSVNITSPSSISDSTIVIPTTCGDSSGEISIYVNGGNGAPYTFAWSAGIPVSTATNSTATGLAPTNLIITVNDNAGCSEEFTFNINPSEFIISIDSLTDATCNGLSDGYTSIAVTGGTTPYVYNWSSGQTTSANTGIPAGTAIVTITDATGCSATEFAIIEQPDSLIQSALTVVDIVCNGSSDGTASVDYIGGTLPYTFNWSNSTVGQTVTGLASGPQSVTVTDDNNCSAITTITISEPSILMIDTAQIMSPMCANVNNGSVTIIASGGISPYSYSWDNGITTTSATGLAAGNYCLTVNDNNLCEQSLCISITDSIAVAIDTVFDVSVCISEDSLVLVGSGSSNPSSLPLSYVWIDAIGDTVSADSVGYVTNFDVGNEVYTLSTYLTSESGCFASQSITATIHDLPDVDAGEDIDMIINGTNILGGDPTSDVGTQFNWSPSTFLDDSTIANPTFGPDIDGEFILNVTVTDDNGCVSNDSILIVVSPEVEIVNIFSPNGDGINDVWTIPFLDQYPNADLKIYNRWGELLFEVTGGYTTPWDATFNGKPLPVGSYYYVLELNHPDATKPITGPLAVIR